MRSRAAVARAAGYPLSIATIGVDGSKAGEFFIRIGATGACHTDTRTLPGAGFEGLIPPSLGHDGDDADYSSKCAGNTGLMRAAPECRHQDPGGSMKIGVAGAGQKIGARPVRRGTAFGGVSSRLESPGHFDRYRKGQAHIDEKATHRMPPADTNRGFDLMHERASIRAAITS